MDDADLKRVAEAATPGPWKVTVVEGQWAVRATYLVDGLRHTRWPATCQMSTDAEHDATFIATFDPPTVLGLLARLSAAEAKAGVLEEAIRVIGRYARSDGDRTFDDCIRDLGLIDDRCRAALTQEPSHEPS
jgi:hypothetical protein